MNCCFQIWWQYVSAWDISNRVRVNIDSAVFQVQLSDSRWRSLLAGVVNRARQLQTQQWRIKGLRAAPGGSWYGRQTGETCVKKSRENPNCKFGMCLRAIKKQSAYTYRRHGRLWRRVFGCVWFDSVRILRHQFRVGDVGFWNWRAV